MLINYRELRFLFQVYSQFIKMEVPKIINKMLVKDLFNIVLHAVGS